MKGKTVVCVKLNKGEINPFDGAALESALCLGFDETTVLTMSPPSSIPVAESITRLGVKVIVLCDSAFAGSDTVATSYILSKAISRLNPDFIFCGRQSTDGDTAQVPPMIAERLGFSSVAGVMEFSESGVKTRAGKSYSFEKKTVYTFERIKNLRFPSMFSEKGEVTV
ncbi:MAG TPA: hypothetical protein DDW54_03405, partial [Clostridiales bacterium]|nr:hypothetical protein [Clostridiales bacterium]